MKKTALILNLVLALSFVLAACTGAQPTLQPEDQVTAETPTPGSESSIDWDKSPDNQVIVVTNCCGFVPDIVRINYLPEAVVWGDGRIVWSQYDENGRRRVLTAQLTEAQLAKLLEGIKNAGFFGWDENYTDMNGPTDMPSKCIKVEADGREHQVCEYWQGAPEAFHLIFENMLNGTGVQGSPFIPTRGYFVARPTPRPDHELAADEFMVWDAGEAQLSLEDAVKGVWLEGDALLRAWDTVNAKVWGGLLKDGEDYYQLTLQIPELSVEPIPAE